MAGWPTGRSTSSSHGRCEFISAYTQPFAMLAVADVLGVPETDHQRLREFFGLSAARASSVARRHRPERPRRARCVVRPVHRRPPAEPRDDALTRLALGTYPDGTTPDVTAVVRTATFLFAAGQETTARLLAVGLKYLCEYPDLQDELRAHPERIPDFIEESCALRAR